VCIYIYIVTICIYICNLWYSRSQSIYMIMACRPPTYEAVISRHRPKQPKQPGWWHVVIDIDICIVSTFFKMIWMYLNNFKIVEYQIRFDADSTYFCLFWLFSTNLCRLTALVVCFSDFYHVKHFNSRYLMFVPPLGFVWKYGPPFHLLIDDHLP
jgi:hypothetical protein